MLISSILPISPKAWSSQRYIHNVQHDYINNYDTSTHTCSADATQCNHVKFNDGHKH